MGVMTFRLKLL